MTIKDIINLLPAKRSYDTLKGGVENIEARAYNTCLDEVISALSKTTDKEVEALKVTKEE